MTTISVGFCNAICFWLIVFLPFRLWISEVLQGLSIVQGWLTPHCMVSYSYEHLYVETQHVGALMLGVFLCICFLQNNIWQNTGVCCCIWSDQPYLWVSCSWKSARMEERSAERKERMLCWATLPVNASENTEHVSRIVGEFLCCTSFFNGWLYCVDDTGNIKRLMQDFCCTGNGLSHICCPAR